MHSFPEDDRSRFSSLEWEVVVIGAGPTGALAAYLLARRGVRVLLVDRARFPRWKVCGCCLNRRAVLSLGLAGLESLLSSQGAVPLHHVRLANRNCTTSVPLQGGYVLSRERFDAALLAAARSAGCVFLSEATAQLGPAGSRERKVCFRLDQEDVTVGARVVLVASGLGSRLLARESGCVVEVRTGSRLGAGALADDSGEVYPAGVVFMACGMGGYIGVVRREDHRLGLAAALDPEQVKQAGGLAEAAHRVLREARLPWTHGMAAAHWRGTPLLTQRLVKPAADRIFVLGDAASHVEPFTGEGIGNALAAALAIAPIACEACHQWSAPLAEEWVREYAALQGWRRWPLRAIATCTRHPLLVTLALVSAIVSPRIARLIAAACF